jgi:hypothetical protein
VKKIIALNRGHDGSSSRQVSSSAARGLGADFSKVEFIGPTYRCRTSASVLLST